MCGAKQIQRYKRPDSVLVLVYTSSQKVLMLKRRQPEDFWQSVTGSLHWDESAPNAARRELFEETGLCGYRIEDCRKVYQFEILPALRPQYAPGTTLNKEYVFKVELPEPLPVHLSPYEHSEYCWLPFMDASALTASWTNRAAILDLFKVI